MPRGRPKKLKQSPVLKPPSRSPKELEDFVREADEVRAITNSAGWSIIERDLTEYRNGLVSRLAYINPKKPEYDEARILFIAVDKLFAIINDYQENRDKALELLNKLENPDTAIVMDVDNEF